MAREREPWFMASKRKGLAGFADDLRARFRNPGNAGHLSQTGASDAAHVDKRRKPRSARSRAQSVGNTQEYTYPAGNTRSGGNNE